MDFLFEMRIDKKYTKILHFKLRYQRGGIKIGRVEITLGLITLVALHNNSSIISTTPIDRTIIIIKYYFIFAYIKYMITQKNLKFKKLKMHMNLKCKMEESR